MELWAWECPQNDHRGGFSIPCSHYGYCHFYRPLLLGNSPPRAAALILCAGLLLWKTFRPPSGQDGLSIVDC
jgi:hypothetical protein